MNTRPKLEANCRLAVPALAGLLAAMAPVPAAAARLYDHLGKGAFGSLSWVSQGYGYYDLHGGEHQILSSETRDFQNGEIGLHGMASSSLWDGKLHATSFASRCDGPSPGSCRSSSASYISAGTAYWEQLQIGEGPETGNIPMKLRVSGATEGLSKAFIRYYVGTQRNPVGLLNSRMDAGYFLLYMGREYESVEFDLSTFYVGKRLPLNLYVELLTNARSDTGGLSIANFGNTATFSWELPPGVTISSASGHFLGAPPVPEPDTWALMAGGLVVMAWLRRRRLVPGRRRLTCDRSSHGNRT